MSARTRRSEAGVTLIELLVAVSLMGLLMTALTGAVIVGFRSTRDTHTSLDQSNAEQIITTYVTKDIQAADTVVVPPATTVRRRSTEARTDHTVGCSRHEPGSQSALRATRKWRIAPVQRRHFFNHRP